MKISDMRFEFLESQTSRYAESTPMLQSSSAKGPAEGGPNEGIGRVLWTAAFAKKPDVKSG